MSVTSSSSLHLTTSIRTAAPTDRIEGWKSIGAYFGRDRTTAIRWARERSLPIHRMPGGKTGTIFALRHELDAWANSDRSTDGEGNAPPPVTLTAFAPVAAVAAAKGPGRRALIWGGAGAMLLASAAIFSPALIRTDPAGTGPVLDVLPQDRTIAERYLAARDLVASRDAQSLERAIPLLHDVTQSAPDYAPGYAALSEALILSREFGIRSDVRAFADARFAAQTALRLDPNLASGHRMLGFIDYWWDHDIGAARRAFSRAIALEPGDPIIRFWYGNILIDHGDFNAGLRNLNAARAMQPGSAAILTDLAWAHWSAGERASPFQTLMKITEDHPRFVVAYDCLATIHLAETNYAGYAAALARVAVLRQERTIAEQAAEVQSALMSDARSAPDVIMRHALRDIGENSRRTYVWSIFVASVAGDRHQTLSLLTLAARRKEKWGEAGIVRRIKQRWRGDAQIMTLIGEMNDGVGRFG